MAVVVTTVAAPVGSKKEGLSRAAAALLWGLARKLPEPNCAVEANQLQFMTLETKLGTIGNANKQREQYRWTGTPEDSAGGVVINGEDESGASLLLPGFISSTIQRTPPSRRLPAYPLRAASVARETMPWWEGTMPWWEETMPWWEETMLWWEETMP